VYLQRIAVRGFRAASEEEIVCEFPGRFSLLVGGNNAGKSTVADALYLAHPHSFPQIPRPTVATLATAPPRQIDISYAFSPEGEREGPVGELLNNLTMPAPSWTRQLERNLGRVRAKTVGSEPELFDALLLIYLPAYRNPLDELARREAQVLLELFRAEQQARSGHRNQAAPPEHGVHRRHGVDADQFVAGRQIVAVMVCPFPEQATHRAYPSPGPRTGPLGSGCRGSTAAHHCRGGCDQSRPRRRGGHGALWTPWGMVGDVVEPVGCREPGECSGAHSAQTGGRSGS
jgi:hypothetical protein